MTFDEIKELINLVNSTKLTDLKIQNNDFEIHIRTKKYYKGQNQTFVSTPQMVAAPAPASAPVSTVPTVTPSAVEKPVAADAPKGKNVVEIKSPIVGTFYRSAGPDKPVFSKVGDTVSQGDVVCIIEAMKLFNEIESDVTGTIIKVLVEDASPVEYDQVLFLVEI